MKFIRKQTASLVIAFFFSLIVLSYSRSATSKLQDVSDLLQIYDEKDRYIGSVDLQPFPFLEEVFLLFIDDIFSFYLVYFQYDNLSQSLLCKNYDRLPQ
jgi:hypothetical protein